MPRIIKISSVIGSVMFLFSTTAFAKDLNQKLIIEAMQGQPEGITTLLDKGVDINAKNIIGCTALMVASSEGRTGMVRWLESLQKTFALPGQDIRTVTVCDREADIYELFLLAERLRANLLVRAVQNRTGNPRIVDMRKIEEKLWPYMTKQTSLGSIAITVPKRDKTPSRQAVLEVRTGV